MNAFLPALVLVATGSPSLDPVLARFEFREPHMGTEFRIVLYATDEASASASSRAAFARIAELDAKLSDYRDDSELRRLCARAGGPPVEISEDLFFVLARGQELAKRTDGAFDMTVGPVVRLWRWARRTRQLPDADRLGASMELVGYELMRLDERARTAELLRPGMQLDLGGIAKGYAGDEAIAVLAKRGITRALVAGSGDIVVSGPPPNQAGWKIGIGPLDPSSDEAKRLVMLRDAAVSTSGDAEQFVEIDGKRYSHIIDPKTGIGLSERSSATVIARRGIAADSLATAASVLGPRRAIELIDATEGAAAYIVRAGDRGVEEFKSSNFPTLARP